MTEQDNGYYKTIQNTLSENRLRELAYGVMLANKASTEVQNHHLAKIRAKIAQTKPYKKPMFSISKMRHAAKMVREGAAKNVNCLVGC